MGEYEARWKHPFVSLFLSKRFVFLPGMENASRMAWMQRKTQDSSCLQVGSPEDTTAKEKEMVREKGKKQTEAPVTKVVRFSQNEMKGGIGGDNNARKS